MNKNGLALLWRAVGYSEYWHGRAQQPEGITDPGSMLDGDVSLHAYIRLVSGPILGCVMTRSTRTFTCSCGYPLLTCSR